VLDERAAQAARGLHRDSQARRRERVGLFTEIGQEEGSDKAEEKAAEEVMQLAIHNLALSWRGSFDPEENFKPGKELYRVKDKHVRVSHVTQTTRGDKDGKYTTVFVAAVFLF
jgi:arginine decarboxylase